VVGFPPDRSPPRAPETLLVAGFTADQITTVRQEVEAIALRCGLDRQRASDWVTAVNELMTNAVRHGGGAGRMRVWHDGRLTCEVQDSGGGFTVADYLGRAHRPTLTSTGGMGLWIVQQMTDALTIESDGTGTTARISIEVDGPSA
jgi:anti-sigma regulatory factor (Ser/Thr protein kinase)